MRSKHIIRGTIRWIDQGFDARRRLVSGFMNHLVVKVYFPVVVEWSVDITINDGV